MLIQEARVGMVVEFGRENGQWTRGEIIKINPTKAKVKTLEARGSGRGGFAGSVWSVPYSMMRPEGQQTPSIAAEDLPYQYSPFDEDAPIMEAIVSCYHRLSPESLTWDGEKPRHQVISDKNRLEGKLRHLFAALGRPVSEGVAYQWSMESLKKAQKTG